MAQWIQNPNCSRIHKQTPKYLFLAISLIGLVYQWLPHQQDSNRKIHTIWKQTSERFSEHSSKTLCVYKTIAIKYKEPIGKKKLYISFCIIKIFWHYFNLHNFLWKDSVLYQIYDTYFFLLSIFCWIVEFMCNYTHYTK